MGGGAREHALGLALTRGPDAPELFFAPGNAGTASIGTNVAVAASDVAGLTAWADRGAMDLVVVGPELPLCLGLVDSLQKSGLVAFGPTKSAARLEGSKSFMKDICKRAHVPTADYAVFDNAESAKAFLRAEGLRVVKADGLCGGKGVVVPATLDEALEAVDGMMVREELGDAGKIVVLEEHLSGEEASFHVVCDGIRAIPLVAAQDHKRALDGDLGPNTGGMGAYAPAPVVTPEIATEIMTSIVEPTLRVMREIGSPFRGVLFVGLMIENGVARVLEFNVRFGDPETAVLVPLFDGDWVDLLDGAAHGNLADFTSSQKPGAALAVVMAAASYPHSPRTGDPITGLGALLPEGGFVLHAGTRSAEAEVVTAGGRVLTVGATAESLAEARERAYAIVDGISWPGEHHRTDIGHRGLVS